MRCAIYTRKSSAEGLQQDFNSIDAQREACANYIASQRSEGWLAIDRAYDDGGYSGGSLERPALKRLLVDLDEDLFDTIVVYKIDRLSRSLFDFVNLVGRFEKKNVTFVAVTQSFSTTTSMGRLTLNVLLSFAQFERELTSERLKDKFAASRARGMWINGLRPFGYRVEKCKLILDLKEAEAVRYIYSAYPKIGSARLISNELTAKGILNKCGNRFTKRTVVRLLQNRLYRGELVHKGRSLSGVHEAIVSESVWAKAQEAIGQSGRRRAALRNVPVGAMLKGMIFDQTGRAMVHTFSYGKSVIYRYYVASLMHKYGPGSDPACRYRAADLERAVADIVGGLESPPENSTRSDDEMAGMVRRLVKRVDIGINDVTITLVTGGAIRTAEFGRITPRKRKMDVDGSRGSESTLGASQRAKRLPAIFPQTHPVASQASNQSSA